jgi:hypothetical protein
MKKFKKQAAYILSATLLLSGSTGVFANDVSNDYNDIVEISEVFPEILPERLPEDFYDLEEDFDEEFSFPPISAFFSVRGIVTEIYTVPDFDMYTVTIEMDGEREAVLVINNETFMLGEPLEIGDDVTGFYATNRPMPAIYPPHYTMAVVFNGDFESVAVNNFTRTEAFEYNLVSVDGSLMLNIGEETIIVSTDGEDYDGDLDGRNLIVVYNVATRSIPAITTPEKIIVLPIEEILIWEHEEDYFEQYEQYEPIGRDMPVFDHDRSRYAIIVNGVGLEGVGARVVYDGEDLIGWFTHVPLRPVA